MVYTMVKGAILGAYLDTLISTMFTVLLTIADDGITRVMARLLTLCVHAICTTVLPCIVPLPVSI